MRSWSYSILLALAAAASLVAQTGQITGLVTDPSGTAVPGAEVTVTNEATSIRNIAKTNELGYYTILYLNPGDYGIRVQKAGFKVSEHPPIKLDVAQIARVDVPLRLGELAESVT